MLLLKVQMMVLDHQDLDKEVLLQDLDHQDLGGEVLHLGLDHPDPEEEVLLPEAGITEVALHQEGDTAVLMRDYTLEEVKDM